MITLLIGGAASGKSVLAESLLADATGVTYLATGVAADEDMAERIGAHRRRRPADWATLEPSPDDVVAAVSGTEGERAGALLIDSLTTWVAAVPDFEVDVEAFCRALTRRGGDVVVVSDEVGMGVHPSTDSGRRFREALGAVNQAVAAVSDRTLLVVAGRVLELGAMAH